MATIKVINAIKKYGDTFALDNITLNLKKIKFTGYLVEMVQERQHF